MESYAARVRAGNEEQAPYPPSLRPSEEGHRHRVDRAPGAVNLYLAYANESLATSDQFHFTEITNIPIEDGSTHRRAQPPGSVQVHLRLAHRRQRYRADPEATCALILTTRPKHRYWIVSAARHFAADLYLNDWLEAKGFQFDVITDLDLHFEGKELLDRYKVIHHRQAIPSTGPRR